ncbi:hypothetical protein L1987_24006 [Smallanthus sonchifolius]|uniref:Uncharacterized protein n=1 Tax=Smallanthus sonchifolius TaxID=185202 RepID=A0ACB9IJ91_9ASTR|nr:hypothetical protein L1987_24006 [Smallanthus sonchifolius]
MRCLSGANCAATMCYCSMVGYPLMLYMKNNPSHGSRICGWRYIWKTWNWAASHEFFHALVQMTGDIPAAKPGTGTVIAVKQLFDAGYESDQEWLLNHQNLVKIIGYCLEGDHRLLVYEFMRRSSLDNHLFRRGTNFERLSWNLRIKVALGVAKGLAYLHSTDVRYHGFKSSNILIDSNYNAKPSDFGLVKDGQEAALQTSVASVAYKPPEYKYRGRLTTSCEIYSFGVLLLELLTGRRSFDENRPSGEQTLVEFAEPFLTSKQKILLIMDPSIEGQYSSTVAKRAALLATKCLMLDPKHRPNSEELVKALEQIQELQKASESSTNDNNVVSYSRLVASTSDGV